MPRRRLGLRVSNSSAGRLGQASQSMLQRSLSNSFSEQSEKRSAGCWDRCQDTGFLLGRSKLGVEVGREAARGGKGRKKKAGRKGGNGTGEESKGKEKVGKEKGREGGARRRAGRGRQRPQCGPRSPRSDAPALQPVGPAIPAGASGEGAREPRAGLGWEEKEGAGEEKGRKHRAREVLLTPPWEVGWGGVAWGAGRLPPAPPAPGGPAPHPAAAR